MSTIALILRALETRAIAFSHNFGSGAVTVFASGAVKVYVEQNFNKALTDLLMVGTPALAIVYGGSNYKDETPQSAKSSTRKAVDRRTASFSFMVADREYGFESKDESAIGGGSTALGAIRVMDAWRDNLRIIDPKPDLALNISPFVPVDDNILPVDPDAGSLVVYNLIMSTSFYETAAA